MKKDSVMALILVMGLIIICSVIYINSTTPLKKEIYEDEWYSFNVFDGSYSVIDIDKKNIILKNVDKFDGCTKYNYNEKFEVFEFNCGKSIEYLNFRDNELILKYNGEEKHYFKDAEEAYNYEFNKYYGISVSDFIDENSHVKSLRLIDYDTLIGYIKDSNFVLLSYGNNCINNECIIFDKTLEKLFVKSPFVYTFDSSNLTEKQLLSLSKIDNLSNEKEFYNGDNPRVLVFEDGRMIETFLIECDGFDCSKYEFLADTVR